MGSAGASPSMDALKADLNPCSLETIPEPLTFDHDARGRGGIWPLVLCCYQLDESIGYRRGQLDLFHVQVPDVTSDQAAFPLRFGPPQTILKPSRTSGILDGKWSSTSLAGHGRHPLFATAHASGEIKLFQLQRQASDETTTDASPRFTLDLVTQSNLPDHGDGIPPLCLSLNFASKVLHEQADTPTESKPIVSTYSNGKVAIHDIIFLESSSSLSIVQRDSWDAHNMFTNPAEVWSADFCGTKAVISCGDEGKVKLWDVRATNRPMHVLSPFAAGATCVSTHVRKDHIVACGSYDETVCLFDTRYLSSKTPLCQSKELGGGVWRLKWHPYKEERLLVAAMHGGCRVVEIDGWHCVEDPSYQDGNDKDDEESSPCSFRVTRKFCEHESMAYGADWLVCKHPTRNGYFEAAASCSFYDRAVFLWDSCDD